MKGYPEILVNEFWRHERNASSQFKLCVCYSFDLKTKKNVRFTWIGKASSVAEIVDCGHLGENIDKSVILPASTLIESVQLEGSNKMGKEKVK